MPDEIFRVVIFMIMGTTVIGFPIALAFARRMDRKSALPKVPTEVMQRLERMEQALDAVAIEVERISEGQRFTTKLLSARSGQTSPGRGVSE